MKTEIYATLKPGKNPALPTSWQFDGISQMFWAAFIAENIKEGETEFGVKIEAKRIRAGKTPPQLRYLNGVVYPAFQFFFKEANGFNPTIEDVKTVLKTHPKIGFCKTIFDGNENRNAPKSCAGADISEVMEYISRLLALANDLGVNLMSPEEWAVNNKLSF